MPPSLPASSKNRVLVLGTAFLLAAAALPLRPLPGPPPQTVEAREKWINARQPPAEVMDAIGLRPGMVVGEVGAGRGRYTVHLAARVGPSGRVYSNDIDAAGLAVIRERCRKDGLGNVETVLGRIDDPLFPKAALDLVFMVYAYHHLDRPVDMLKSIRPCLKPGATVVVIDPDPVKSPGERESEYTRREKIAREAEAAGFEIAREETFLPGDALFILKAGIGPAARRP